MWGRGTGEEWGGVQGWKGEGSEGERRRNDVRKGREEEEPRETKGRRGEMTKEGKKSGGREMKEAQRKKERL